MMEKILLARKAIVENISVTKKRTGSINCPVCKKGDLRYSQASNGHIWGCCETPGCVRWME